MKSFKEYLKEYQNKDIVVTIPKFEYENDDLETQRMKHHNENQFWTMRKIPKSIGVNMWCSYCGSKLHTIKNCPKTYSGQINRNNIRCSYCGSNKHNYDGCHKLSNKNEDDYILD